MHIRHTFHDFFSSGDKDCTRLSYSNNMDCPVLQVPCWLLSRPTL